MKFKKAILGISYTILLVLCTLTTVYAQPGSGDEGTPCSPDDTTDCTTPLDNWVFILVAIALVFVTINLYRKQKLEGTYYLKKRLIQFKLCV